MASIISAGTTSNTALNLSADTTGVLQLASNGSTTALTIDTSQNVGIGVTPSAWRSTNKALQIGQSAAIFGYTASNIVGLSANSYIDSAGNEKYITNGTGGSYFIGPSSGEHRWSIFPNNTSGAGAALTPTEVMRITSAGNVGIGTSSPAQKLHVSTASGNSFLQISSGSNNIYYGWENSRSVASVQSNTAITFDTGGSYTERMRITSGGDVGIGTSSPGSRLSVTGSANIATFDGGTNTSITLTGSGRSDIFLIDSGAATDQKRLTIRGNDGDFVFGVENDAVTTFTERMRITATGQLGLGVTPNSWAGGFKVLQIGRGSYSADGISNLQITMNAYYNGSDWKYISANRAANMYFDLGGSINIRTTNTVGTVDGSISWTDGPYVAAAGTSWTNASDEKLKNITGEITDAVSKVQSLRAAEFTWKADTENKPQVGLIAQDLQKVLPECVVVPQNETNVDGKPTFLGVNYDQVIPLLVAAIKELKAELDATKAEVAALKGVN